MTPVLGKSIVAGPGVGCTQTFITIGQFDTQLEADNCNKYINTKFVRALLSTLKVTQHNPPQTWSNVPLQDFTSNSDIDWTQPIQCVDLQLYRKYGLTDKEIQFIEDNICYRDEWGGKAWDSDEIPTDAVTQWMTYWGGVTCDDTRP